ncbi:MAG TPA: RodZ domain-containing protein [Steroidobacteraceae bacterium]|jgi:cytoskeleton protein RodZ
MAEGIGARLRSARERSRLTILQAAEKLHVDADILEALEAADFAALGAPVFVKGHLRHYAELVGESPEALFELYAQETRVPPPDLTRIPKPPPDDAGKLVVPAVVVVIGFAVVGTVWWVLSLSHHQWTTAPSRPMPVSVAAATPVPQEQLTQPVRLAVGPHTVDPAARPGVAPAAELPAAAGPPIDAVFTYSADSWTEVYDATGRRLLYGMSTGPVTRKLEGVPPLTVMLGDASGVTIEVGGRAEVIARFVRADHTARFLIAADGRVLAAPRKKGG